MQAIVSVVGAAAFPAGIACVVLDGRDHVGAIMLARAGTVLLSMALFAVTVFRTSSGERAGAGRAWPAAESDP